MLKSKVGQEELMYLSSFLSKKLKINFGKGPETCKTIVKHNNIYVHIRNFITPAEEALRKKNQLNLAIDFRTAILETIFQEYKVEVYSLLKVELDLFHYDWDYNLNQAFIMFRGKEHSKKEDSRKENIFLKEQIITIGSKVHLMPEEVNVEQVNGNLYVVECEGTMCTIGKTLFNKGLSNFLHEQSCEIKKWYCTYMSDFETIFHRKIDGFYLLCDYQMNKNYLVFCLK